MFTQACFIRKNTYDLRHSLNNMGKINCTQKVLPILISNYEIYCGVHDFEESIDNLMLNGFIDCGTNEELFLAIAALRDDSDKDQWFITQADQAWYNLGTYMPKGSMFKCLEDDRYMGQNPDVCNGIVPSRKATVEELIKHFSV